MELQNLLDKLRQKQENQICLFYKKDGKLTNICYQDQVFFKVVPNRKIRFLNPLKVVEEINKLNSKELQLVAKGKYMNPVHFKKDYDKKGDAGWKLY